MKIVVDTNIVFSALANSTGTLADLIIASSQTFHFYANEYLLLELRIVFVALSLYLDAYLWTGDKVLYNGLKAKGFDKVIRTSELKYIIER